MVNFRLLGEFEVEAGGRPVDVGYARQRAVLAVLVLEVNRTVSPDRLADRVWGEHQPRRPRDAIYSYLSRLRTALSNVDDVEIRRNSGGYLLAADPMSVDMHRFRHLVRQAGAAKDDHDALALLAPFACSASRPARTSTSRGRPTCSTPLSPTPRSYCAGSRTCTCSKRTGPAGTACTTSSGCTPVN